MGNKPTDPTPGAYPGGEPATVRAAAEVAISAETVERDLTRTINRLQDAIDSHDPRALREALRTAEPCIKRVRAWLDEREEA
ncbi:hypothetical protein SAMN05443665_10074 [Actinomadura meyerae]|uniref:Uncharacterized protein n=1 Tax=Actinomadura meyerae TaxID=240840 RepID=A0A239G5F7_9ACTN|nr:hypothetical protein [Actinomadura meyerae]SNS63683.1 hypothetical protein SAMN05443665_10074 [Actinomadura meyerae]